MICPNCKKENDNYQTVCTYCGEPLTPGFVMCPSCGKVLREGDNICPRCHQDISSIMNTNKKDKASTTVTPMYKVITPYLYLMCSLMIVPLVFFSIISLIELIRLVASHSSYANINAKFISFMGSLIIIIVTLIYRISINYSRDLEVLEKKTKVIRGLMIASLSSYLVVLAFESVQFVMQIFFNNLDYYSLSQQIFEFYSLASIPALIVLFIFFVRNTRVRSR